ncbi:MAG: EF-hand domain-containing protein [Limimaricola soesokkakensis]|uniref:EF-hand domain-containing protein n=1 Tax=Limimaricola soesokkakensis TaxID=1343159 RepID=UPI004058A40B
MKPTTLLLSASFGVLASSALALTFAQVDANGDGSLDATEFAAAYPETAETYFSLYDQDGNGFATAAEVRAASDLLSEGITIEDIDLDENGEIDQEEVAHVFSARAQVALSKFDANADGNVTLNEVRASDDPREERGRGVENRNQGQETSASARGRVQIGGSANANDGGNIDGRVSAKVLGNSGSRGQDRTD